MRGYDRPQTTMLTLVNPEKRVPANHAIRLITALAEVALKELSPPFAQLQSEVGRPPERLLKASLFYEHFTVDGRLVEGLGLAQKLQAQGGGSDRAAR